MGEIDRLKPGALAETDRPKGLIVVGYVMAMFMPLVGFILGVVAITRPNRWAAKHGVGVVVTSIVAFVLWVLVIAAGVNSAARKADQEINHSVQTSREELKRQEHRSQAELKE
jgi:large-conductance mechanosensitive channel